MSASDASFDFPTLVGGSGTEFFLMPTVDAKGNVVIVGNTTSTDFPTTSDAIQPRYGGGSGDGVLAVVGGDELIRTVTIGPGGSLVLGGKTSSLDLPVTPGALQPRLAGGTDAFLVSLVTPAGDMTRIWLPMVCKSLEGLGRDRRIQH